MSWPVRPTGEDQCGCYPMRILHQRMGPMRHFRDRSTCTAGHSAGIVRCRSHLDRPAVRLRSVGVEHAQHFEDLGPGVAEAVRPTAMTQITVDGVMQGNGHATPEEPASGFTRDGWALGAFADDTGEMITRTYQRADAFLFGRRTYEMFAETWGARPKMQAHPSGSRSTGRRSTSHRTVSRSRRGDPSRCCPGMRPRRSGNRRNRPRARSRYTGAQSCSARCSPPASSMKVPPGAADVDGPPLPNVSPAAR